MVSVPKLHLAGERYGRLVVIAEAPRRSNGGRRWRCVCDCGGETVVDQSNLRSGRQRSCGCMAQENRVRIHEESRLPESVKREGARRRGRRYSRRNSARIYTETKADPLRWAAVLRRAREWAKRNPEHKAALTRNRRARLKDAEGRHTADDVRLLLHVQDGCCAMCGADVTVERHVDHIVPISKGGRNDILNLQILCPSCNMRKSDKMPEDEQP